MVFYVMGGTIVAAWTASLLLTILVLRQRFADQAFAWALRLGVVISFVGKAIAILMTTPTGAQIAANAASHSMPISGRIASA